MDYVPLQVKTCFSLLQSINNIKKLVSYAASLGYKSLAITDTGNMFGVPEFCNECKKNNIKPIIGLELIVKEKSILLYAMNEHGYQNLVKLCTIYSECTISSERQLQLEDLRRYNDNVLLIMPFESYDQEIYQIYKYHYVGYYTLEQKNKLKRNKLFINNVSYLKKEDHEYLDYLYMIKEKKVLGEYLLNTHQNQHLLTKEEIELISDEEDIETTKKIAELCTVELVKDDNLLPIYHEQVNSYQYLTALCNKGLKKRLNDNVSEIYQKRLDYELEVIEQMGFCNYFLIVWDYVKYAKQNNILVGPGRGSAISSLVSYTLGITDIDPLQYELLFERFLNPGRKTMPDIDIDFSGLERQRVIDYVVNKYGSKRALGIITFDTLATKQVITDVAKILGLFPGETESIKRQLSAKETLLENYNNNPQLKNLINNNTKYQKLYKIALKLEGLPRNVGRHASGIVMSKIDLDQVIPLWKRTDNTYVTGYSMQYLEFLGLLKMDFLGVSTLNQIQEVLNNIRKNEKLNITFSNIPMNDQKTFEIFKKATTDGIFQFESVGMRNFLQKLQVSSFDDLIVAIALYRPGAMNFIDNYIQRKQGLEQVEYLDPILEPILKPTYGIIIYQEQIIQIARTLAGYSLEEADIFRSAISKKKEEVLLQEKPKFIQKSIQNGFSPQTVEQIYNLILKFAEYGFNKSHSVGYATVAYKMAYLKTYFFKYFLVALLNKEIGNIEKTKTYIAELRQHKIKILPPNINQSSDKYMIVGDGVQCPLSIIAGIGAAISEKITEERRKKTYQDFIDFATRTYSSTVDKKVLTSLIKAGCFNSFGINEKTLLENLDKVMNYVLLAKDATTFKIPKPKLENVPNYTKNEQIENQLNQFGFYLSDHPTNNYKSANELTTTSIEENYGKIITLVLLIDRIKEVSTKKNDIMAFVTASDEYGSVSLTLFPQTYKQYNQIQKNDIIKIEGKIEKRFAQYQVIVNKLEILESK